jgi:hypothetical protein
MYDCFVSSDEFVKAIHVYSKNIWSTNLEVISLESSASEARSEP